MTVLYRPSKFASRGRAIACTFSNLSVMKQPASGPDPIVNSDRMTGSTSPVTGPESTNVVGRPATEKPQTAFHEPAETTATEAENLSEEAALTEGGSFDAIAPVQDADAK